MEKESPTSKWTAWMEAATIADQVHGESIMLNFVILNIWKELKEEGFAMPPQRKLEEALTRGVEPLRQVPMKDGLQRDVKLCSYTHVLNLLWGPIIDYIEAIHREEAPQWNEKLGLHKEAILQEMKGLVASPDEALEMDMFIEILRNTIKIKLNVDVPAKLILKVVGPVVPLSMDPTPSNAMHILRSSLSAKLVGPAMAAQLNRLILAEISELPVKLIPEETLNLQIRQNLIASLGQDHGDQEKGDDTQDNTPLQKMSRTSASIDKNMANKTSQILWMLRNRLATSRVADTASSARDLLASMSSKSNDGPAFQELQLKDSLGRHLLFLDGAVDRHLTEQLWDLREAGTFAGVAIATDESPPSQPRFRGLRFQITVLYLGTFLPVEDWESASTPPIQKRTCLGDIMHCPGKKGADVSRCLEKQMSRVGLNSFDVVAGTGDGGGENEGHQGVHWYFESLGTGYVRRRCIPHISWRTCDLAIRVSGLDLKGICTYLCEGITWSRLRELATTGQERGGLGIFQNSSQKCKDIFGKSPAAIVVSRPDTDLRFLKFLQGKEHILHRLAEKDLEQRSLNADTRAAVLTLGNIKTRIHRRVLQEILERCMFLLYYNQKHPYVATSTSWEELQQKSVSEIVDLTLKPVVLERFGRHEEGLQELREIPRTWVHLAVLEVVGDENIVSEWLQEALTFHRSVSDQAAAHLNLLLDNTFRTPWLAAKLLSTDKVLARTSATTLMRHLATTRPPNLSAFEKHMFLTRACGRTLMISPKQSLQSTYGAIRASMRSSSDFWLQGSSWPLTRCWIVKGSMLGGSGPVSIRGS